jgi:hypothetical protein
MKYPGELPENFLLFFFKKPLAFIKLLYYYMII